MSKKAIIVLISLLLTSLLVFIGIFLFTNKGLSNQQISTPTLFPTQTSASLPRAQNTTGLPLSLPPGFAISIFAQDLGDPRVMITDEEINILVSSPSLGKVFALSTQNPDGSVGSVITVVSGLNRPHGLALRCLSNCELFVAETDKVSIYDYDRVTLKATFKKKLVDLPSGGNHVTRTIILHPRLQKNVLLVSIGSTCNVCHEADSRRASIQEVDINTGEMKPFAAGLRNAVFMASPFGNDEIWVTEMGRDNLGDNLPPDEINIVGDGKNYGWPYCYGKNIHDDDFDPSGKVNCSDKEASYIDMPAHSAPLGLAFVPEEGLPQEYWHNLLVAYHGSWNRNVPTGYKVVRYKLDPAGKYLGEEDFITGWLTPDRQVLGRPVDILIHPGGKIYISDDKRGVIYQVSSLSTFQVSP